MADGPGPPERPALGDPGLRLEQGEPVFGVAEEAGLGPTGRARHADQVAGARAPAADEVGGLDPAERGRDQGQLVVPIDVAADEPAPVPGAAVGRAARDLAEPGRVVEPGREQERHRLGSHGRDVREGDGRGHPAPLPVGHVGREVRGRVEHVRGQHQAPVAAGEHGAVVLDGRVADHGPDDAEQGPVIHRAAPPSRARSGSPGGRRRASPAAAAAGAPPAPRPTRPRPLRAAPDRPGRAAPGPGRRPRRPR